MSLIAGSYERFIWGFKLKPLTHDPSSQSLALTQLFSYPSHIAPITTVAAAGPAAASGSSDDTIHIYDLSSAASLGPLHHFSSSITSLSFYSPPNLSFPRNLISASADGSISIFDTEPFVLLKSFRSHKKGINDLAVHPSGKLALSVSRDGCLAMSNLMRGKRSFCCRLGKEATIVKFDGSGERFFMVSEEKIGVHLAEDARLLFELENEKRVLCAAPGESGILYTGGESRSITAWDTNSGKVAYCIEDAHSTRVKGIVVLTKDGGVDDDPYLVASASSDGFIRAWDVRMAIKGKPNPLAEANTKSRLTCLAGSSVKSSKRPQIGNSAPKEEEDVAEEV
ncbi:p21-activated protein kinase-interacting protein 1-like [Durio zibethinus]|uniref:P21-activated protein kinase-interacting protein 1-like n=1 Tax=Durio zibethinus TaxID=66656 RepID=A0A6P5WJA6_DURZI|nr:p21-activated protein kinase-interacting protein 1-like [Durio zibethinus]